MNSDLEYTILGTGDFLEYVFEKPLFIDIRSHSIEIYDGGEHPFSTTSVQSVAKAVSNVFKNPSSTKNKTLYIHDSVVIQNKLLLLARKYTPDAKWTETHIQSEVAIQSTIEAIPETVYM